MHLSVVNIWEPVRHSTQVGQCAIKKKMQDTGVLTSLKQIKKVKSCDVLFSIYWLLYMLKTLVVTWCPWSMIENGKHPVLKKHVDDAACVKNTPFRCFFCGHRCVATPSVLGQLPTGDNSPPDKIKPNYCPSGPQSLGQFSTRTTLLGPQATNKSTHQDQYLYGGELSWWSCPDTHPLVGEQTTKFLTRLHVLMIPLRICVIIPENCVRYSYVCHDFCT